MQRSPNTINRSELEKIPYIDAESIGGRTLTTLTFYDEKEWHMWLVTPDGLIPLKGEPVEADYFGRERQSDRDACVAFLDFMAQRACWIDALHAIGGLSCDIHNLGASLAKVDLFYEASKDRKTEVARFVSTEIEYIFGVCRSIFDLLQKTIARLWNRVTPTDKALQKKNLPESFRAMVMRDRTRMSVDEIIDRWSIPRQLAEYYFKQGPFFELLRSYRDKIAHHGQDLRFLFVTERGFAISADTEPFATLNVWNDEHMLPNRLASLRPVLAHIITETLRACEEFTDVMQRFVVFPPPIAPGFTLFLRGHHMRELLQMQSILENCLWWDQDPDEFAASPPVEEKEAEQGVAPQSATRSELDSEGGDKLQPESEERSR